MPLFQGMHTKGGGNTVMALQPPCACAGGSCGLEANLKRRSAAWGGCLPLAAGGTVPDPPWWNFSSARPLIYKMESNGTIAAEPSQRSALFYGLPRPASNTCSPPRHLYSMPIGATGPV